MYVLKQYDIELVFFEIDHDKINGQSCHIERIIEENKDLLPIGLMPTDDGLMTWLKSRIIPKNRTFVESFLAKNGLSRKDTKGILDVCFGLSVNDAYWIVDSDFSGKFKDYNLYEHDFVKALSLIAYTGYGTSRAKGFTSSPEFTTAGMLRKGWRRLQDKVVLYKGGSEGAANAGNEPFSEFLASQIAEKMGVRHVTYGLSKWKGSLCSTCELFCDIDHSYVPIYRFFKKDVTTMQIAEFMKKMGESCFNDFSDMMVFDALIYNEDRHLGNYGLIVDNKTNKPIAFAPLFDHGLSLFNYAMMDDLEHIMDYRKTRLTANGVCFDDIASAFISSRQKEMLRKMIGFKFKKHSSYNLPAKRIAILESFLQMRVKELLEL